MPTLTSTWAVIHDPAVDGPLVGLITAIGLACIAVSAPEPTRGSQVAASGSAIMLTADDGAKLWARAYGAAHLAIAPLGLAVPPKQLLTNGGGNHARIRVDPGQTGFFDGREAFFFWEINLAAGATRVIKFTSSVNWIAWAVSINLDAGSVQYKALTEGTEGGAFSTSIPVLRRNTMTEAPAYTPQATATTGGSLAGGTIINSRRIVAANATAQQQTVGAAFTERGLAAGTYYLTLTNFGTGTATGDITMLWEERP